MAIRSMGGWQAKYIHEKEEHRKTKLTLDSLEGLLDLVKRIQAGQAKYPEGCTILSLLDEAGEVAHAVNKREPVERVREELLDVAAVAMRLYFGQIDRDWRSDFEK